MKSEVPDCQIWTKGGEAQPALTLHSASTLPLPLPPSHSLSDHGDSSLFLVRDQSVGLYLLVCSLRSPSTDSLRPLLHRLRSEPSPTLLHIPFYSSETR